MRRLVRRGWSIRSFAMFSRLIVLIMMMALTGLGTAPAQGAPTPIARPTPSPTPESGMAIISTPGDGAVIFGVVPIVGTATSPALVNYQLQWLSSADPGVQWQTIVGPISQQVNNAILGQWDTTKVADGTYQIRLQLTLGDGTTVGAYVQHITVSNQQPTPLASPVGLPTVTLVPTLGPSPTPLIQQPPTATDNPTLAALAANANTTSNDSQFGIDLSGVPIGSAVAIGVTGTLALAVIGGGYAWLKARYRIRRKRRRSVR